MSFMWYCRVVLNKLAACVLSVAKMSILSLGLGGVCGARLLNVSPAFRTLSPVEQGTCTFPVCLWSSSEALNLIVLLVVYVHMWFLSPRFFWWWFSSALA